MSKEKYRDMGGNVYTREELEQEMLDDATGVPAENFVGGKFDFDAWLGEELSMGSIICIEDESMRADVPS
ncbi:hypothetical protein [Mycolicibacterium aubagnense]|uniref:Uncharacterized protein n=1 Tax=Mycolicibacterium aubagnense TaxID=319707 RepID=A0ABN5YYC8_9MYCO|nr:hypothetical protein [Mycolicibacterium aubagnense]TLH58181.1 hypothetical protein C1S80_21235 [Mycolicibacterium aubagnense]WGI31598.1 hypothetical protein QDT91_20540 [Mycolicibacterium aubagnense]BBX86942.1 hypothetical protein MAUB_48150 [Mycolicibacterium aubagnense]